MFENEVRKMKILSGNKAALTPGFVTVPLLSLLAMPMQAVAGITKPLRDVPEHLGTGNLKINEEWSLIGLLGLAVVIVLLAVFYRRDKEQ